MSSQYPNSFGGLIPNTVIFNEKTEICNLVPCSSCNNLPVSLRELLHNTTNLHNKIMEIICFTVSVYYTIQGLILPISYVLDDWLKNHTLFSVLKNKVWFHQKVGVVYNSVILWYTFCLLVVFSMSEVGHFNGCITT